MGTFGRERWLVVLIFVYCVARELIRVIGRDRVRTILFGARASARSRT